MVKEGIAEINAFMYYNGHCSTGCPGHFRALHQAKQGQITHRFAQLAGNTPFLAGGVPSECMLPSESWADSTLLKGVIELQNIIR